VGIAVLILFGAAGAPFVYGATVAGLMLAFALGRLLPEDRLVAWLNRIGMAERARFLSAAAHPDLSEQERLCSLFRDNPIARRLIGWRYVAVAALLNLPGNVIVGGGGGIGLLAGASRAFKPAHFALSVMVAVAPVPLAVVFLGPAFLG
jgi:hypothetical protein